MAASLPSRKKKQKKNELYTNSPKIAFVRYTIIILLVYHNKSLHPVLVFRTENLFPFSSSRHKKSIQSKIVHNSAAGAARARHTLLPLRGCAPGHTNRSHSLSVGLLATSCRYVLRASFCMHLLLVVGGVCCCCCLLWRCVCWLSRTQKSNRAVNHSFIPLVPLRFQTSTGLLSRTRRSPHLLVFIRINEWEYSLMLRIPNEASPTNDANPKQRTTRTTNEEAHKILLCYLIIFSR